MSVSKLTINGATQMDLTQDTVDAENLMTGYTAHAADGSAVTGTHVDGGGGAAGESGALFIDYDGTELYTYTTAQALALSELPANPTHTGLTAQGWNWSLENIQSYLTKYPDGLVVVGQMYITDDGKTRIYIHLGERRSPKLGLIIQKGAEADIDWGDGTEHDTLTSPSSRSAKFTPAHNYASSGDYIIKISVTTGKVEIGGDNYNNTGTWLLHETGMSAQNVTNDYYVCAIKKIEIGANLSSFNAYSFFDCRSLESITIPNSINSIGNGIFQRCIGLNSVTLPKSGIISMGYMTFEDCESLISVSIPDCIKTFDRRIFYNCNILKKTTIPKDVTLLGVSMFENCYSITNVKIPDGVYIPEKFLNGCNLIKSINIPDSILSIQNTAFGSCKSLESIVIPYGITAITDSLFSSDTLLKNVTIPNGVNTIGNYAFSNCISLESIIMPQTVTSIGDYAFQNCTFKSINVPNSVTSLGSYVFYYCQQLENVNIPDDVTIIKRCSFCNCVNLRSIVIPSGVTSIETYAFATCYSLTNITIPANVTSIGTYGFSNCGGMTEYHFLPTTPPTLGGTNAFQGIPSNCIIYVPYSADHSILAAYQAATNWSTYASQMQEEPQ